MHRHHAGELLAADRAEHAAQALARAHAIASTEQVERWLLESGLWWARALWRAGQRELAEQAFTAAAARVGGDDAFAAAAEAWSAHPRTVPPLPAELESAPP